MSLVLPDEPNVNEWLRERGIQHNIRELECDPALCADCGPKLLELFKCPFSFYIRAHIASALFARRLSPQEKREAVDVLLAYIKENAEKYGTLDSLVLNELTDNVSASKVREIGEMMFETRYGPLRHSFARVLGKIGDAEAIPYLKRAAQDGVLANFALQALARLRVDGTLDLCEAALKIPNVLFKDVIRETTAKLKRQLAKRQGARSHVTTEAIPDGLKEWSANLDGCDLPKVLRKIQKCIEEGFGKGETAEVRSAADDLSVDQEVRFKFKVRFQGKDANLWLEIFCDDEGAYDLYVFGVPELVEKIEGLERKTA